MIDYVKEYGVTDLDFEYIMNNLKRDIIDNLVLSESSVREVLSYLNKIGNDTLYDFAVHTLEKPQIYARYYTRSEIREIFAFVREAYYPLFQDFYECNVMSLEKEGLL